MVCKTLFSQQFTRCLVPLLVGSMAGMGSTEAKAANPIMAQHPSSHLLLMAQSSAITGSWQLVNMTESTASTPMVPPQDTVLTAEFSGDRIAGSGGCNRFTGSYQAEGEQLSITPLASTRMACGELVMSQETRYLTALQGAQRYEVNDRGELQIFYQTEQQSGVLRFTAQTVRGLW